MSKIVIFSAPEHIKKPVIDFSNYDSVKHQKQEEKYLDDIKEFCTSQWKGKYVGKVAKYPVADGYALYMVAQQSPMQLIHLELGDEWHYQHVEYLPAKEIKQNIDSQEALSKLFGKL